MKLVICTILTAAAVCTCATDKRTKKRGIDQGHHVPAPFSYASTTLYFGGQKYRYTTGSSSAANGYPGQHRRLDYANANANRYQQEGSATIYATSNAASSTSGYGKQLLVSGQKYIAPSAEDYVTPSVIGNGNQNVDNGYSYTAMEYVTPTVIGNSNQNIDNSYIYTAKEYVTPSVIGYSNQGLSNDHQNYAKLSIPGIVYAIRVIPGNNYATNDIHLDYDTNVLKLNIRGIRYTVAPLYYTNQNPGYGASNHNAYGRYGGDRH